MNEKGKYWEYAGAILFIFMVVMALLWATRDLNNPTTNLNTNSNTPTELTAQEKLDQLELQVKEQAIYNIGVADGKQIQKNEIIQDLIDFGVWNLYIQTDTNTPQKIQLITTETCAQATGAQ